MEGGALASKAYDHPLVMVFSFCYLGQTLTTIDENCPVVISNLWKLRHKLACLSRILGQEGEDARASGRFYLTLVQATLLFGSETWVVTPRMAKTLGGFYHRAVRQITVQLPWWRSERIWYYPPLTDAMREVMLEELETYISRRQNTVAQYITTWTILDLCLGA